MKSKLDILIKHRVLTEKQTIASKVINLYILNQPGRFKFSSEIDSNKLAVFSCPNDREVDIYISVILKKLFLHPNVDTATINQINNHQISYKEQFQPAFVDHFLSNHIVFTYRLVIGGSAVLNAMLDDSFMNFLTIECLRIEKAILDYGR